MSNMRKGRPQGGAMGAADPKALGRAVKKLFEYYPVMAPLTMFCILFSSVVSSIPSLFVQNVLSVIEKWYLSGDWASAKAETSKLSSYWLDASLRVGMIYGMNLENAGRERRSRPSFLSPKRRLYVLISDPAFAFNFLSFLYYTINPALLQVQS